MKTDEKIQETLARLRPYFHAADFAFAERVWTTPQEVYLNRLRAIGFENQGIVLDAGCGYGQWSLALATLNDRVEAIDVHAGRLMAADALLKAANCHAARVQYGSVAEPPFEANTFDAILAYSVVHATPWPQVLRRFYALLRPRGRAYLTVNGLGWYLRYFIEAPRSGPGHDPRWLAACALMNTVSFEDHQRFDPRSGMIITPEALRAEAEAIGFKVLGAGADGATDLAGVAPRAFFQGEYHGQVGVHEILLERP
ncbi:class I SAM-dependent methyltransferase [Myxococcota bacterium]|nr:class I SAM-dependent methyltransferase [Myxococcota bacterium]MBU1430241.1 class I SAM-dependent methyltransferase [Myxococcota bacterium]MBU1898351.1 class I SAM-dependent methyltransferase [Myxococcota bacterium]